jgi:transposase-like protein
MSQVAKDFGISQSCLVRWVAEVQDDLYSATLFAEEALSLARYFGDDAEAALAPFSV